MRFRQGFGSSTWQLSQNPIFLKDLAVPHFADVGLSVQQLNGIFKRPQEFKQERLLGFGAKGISGFKDWKFYGEFSYGKHYRDSIKYANVARPYDGNPFITADAVGGNWTGDQLTAKLQLAFPQLGRWQTGIKLAYETEQSARDNDPKPLYRVLDYAIEPSIAYQFNKKQLIAFNASYLKTNEHTETGYYTDQNPLLYSLRGYGEFSRGPVVSSERFRTGWGWKFGADYRYKNEQHTLAIGAKIGYRTADINDGIAKPIFIGGFDERNAELFFSYEQQTQDQGWLANIKGSYRDGAGFDPVFQAINPAYYLLSLAGRLAWWKQKNAKLQLAVNLYPGLTYSNYTESIAKTDWTSLMLHQEVGMGINYKASKRTSFLTDFLIGYHANLQKELIINRPTILSPILVQPDFIINSTNYFSTTLNATMVYSLQQSSIALKGGFDLKNALGSTSNLGTRKLFYLQLNLLF